MTNAVKYNGDNPLHLCTTHEPKIQITQKRWECKLITNSVKVMQQTVKRLQ